jgi:ketosteroid isomerase-like protein
MPTSRFGKPLNANEQRIRDFYAARARRDWDAVAGLLADDVRWYEAGAEDYSGSHLGRDAVVALLRRLVEVTGGTFALEPLDFVVTADHVATNVRWHAERESTRVEGNDLAVFRLADGKIAQAWFFPDGYDPEALSTVFALREHDA